MPAILDRLVRQLQAKGHSKGSAFAIASRGLQKSGNLKKGSNKATKKGTARGKMTPGQRAKSRASKAFGKSPKSFKFNEKTNRATLKKSKSKGRTRKK